MQVDEMTLRDCLHAIFTTGGIHLVGNIIHSNYYTKESNDAQAVCNRYTQVMQELMELDKHVDDVEIVIRETDSLTVLTDDDEKTTLYMVLRDSTTDLYAADLTPWRELIDLNIINETDKSMHEVIACILWEITFWGWTDQEVANERNKLKKTIEDIESGKEHVIPWNPQELLEDK